MINLTEWERQRLSTFASSTTLTYMGHHENGRNGKSGLFPHEQKEMELWKELSEKLCKPVDLPEAFEKWWQASDYAKSGGTVSMPYSARKQLAWDAFFAANQEPKP